MEKVYNILGKTVRLVGETRGVYDTSLSAFEVEDLRVKDDVLISFKKPDEGYYGLSVMGKELLSSISNMFFSCTDRSYMLYSIDCEYRNHVLQEGASGKSEALMEVLMSGFYSRVSLEGFALVHASAVCVGDKSIVFTGNSGIGKTTQAELWKKYRNSDILNGDKVFLSIEDSDVISWGSPWKGSSEYALNDRKKTRAIVVLSQGTENRVKKLSDVEVIEEFLPHIFYPKWDMSCDLAVLDTVSRAIELVDVYKYECTPDERAVEFLESVLF